MALKDFDKISNEKNVEKKNEKVLKIDNDIDMKTIQYFVFHIDELIELLIESYEEYVNAKLNFEFRKDKLQTSIDWGKENALRESNDLPKVTTQTQRDSVINLKVKDLNVKMKSCEVKHKYYKKIFNFIDKNFDLLSENVAVKKCDVNMDDK